MKVADKYLPTTEDRVLFLENRIAENKKQLYGGVLEILVNQNNKPVIDQTEYMMKQLVDNIDLYQAELDKLV